MSIYKRIQHSSIYVCVCVCLCMFVCAHMHAFIVGVDDAYLWIMGMCVHLCIFACSYVSKDMHTVNVSSSVVCIIYGLTSSMAMFLRPCGQPSSRDSPISIFDVPTGSRGLQIRALLHKDFQCAPLHMAFPIGSRTWTRIIRFVQQVFYPLNQFPCSQRVSVVLIS